MYLLIQLCLHPSYYEREIKWWSGSLESYRAIFSTEIGINIPTLGYIQASFTFKKKILSIPLGEERSRRLEARLLLLQHIHTDDKMSKLAHLTDIYNDQPKTDRLNLMGRSQLQDIKRISIWEFCSWHSPNISLFSHSKCYTNTY